MLLLPFLSRAADLPGTKKGPGVPGTLKFRFPGTKRRHFVPGNRFSRPAICIYRNIRCDKYCSKAGLYASETWMRAPPMEMS